MVDLLKDLRSQILRTTCRIAANCPGKPQSIGTGLHFTFKARDGKSIPALITCKHVVEGCESVDIVFSEAEVRDNPPAVPTGKHVRVTLPLQQIWFGHPDPDIDIGVIMLGPCFGEFESKRKGRCVYRVTILEDQIAGAEVLDQLAAMEDIVMVGYPTGVWDAANNLPILRRGVTSSHPGIPFNGRSEGIVDIACFWGSSGSPVFICDEGVRKVGEGYTVGSRFHFLGILKDGFVWTPNGITEATDLRMDADEPKEIRLPIHLGSYVRAEEITKMKEALFAHFEIDK